MAEFVNLTLSGLTLGALIALVAVGYSMVYGIIKLINFAHGEFYMAGAFTGLLGLTWLAGPGGWLYGGSGLVQLLLALMLAGVTVAALAMLVERVAYRPIRGSGRINALLTAVGVSLFLQNSFVAVFGQKNQGFPPILDDTRYPRWEISLDELTAREPSPYRVAYTKALKADGEVLLDPRTGKPTWIQVTVAEAGREVTEAALARARTDQPERLYAYARVTLGLKQVMIFLALGVSALGLYFLVQRTRVGRAMRAVSHDVNAARLMGISSDWIIALTFLVGGMLAGLGGVLAGGMFIGSAYPTMGFLLGLKAFIAAVLGGIGSILGALLGGLILGLVEVLAQHYADQMLFQGASAYRDAICYLVLIAVLVFKPSGILGRFEGEKV